MGGGGSGNAFIDYAMQQAEERKAREKTVPIEDKKRLTTAKIKSRRRKKEGRSSTLLSKNEGSTLGVA